ncbi:hypothetical protein BCR43DRAFT_486180 [Syncephalastrum racemosum]|uniref:Uncharacterized protein n=1 Tax=Syncephalastrum racemosum TaxID=13706 RepID=A0A1X2HNQ1_SYNRA|nr:hypothetical protein BCR43DRAFT_486180 [Syncephalastrum racemosum]
MCLCAHTYIHTRYTCRHRGELLTVSTGEKVSFSISYAKNTQFGLAPPPTPYCASVFSAVPHRLCFIFSLFSLSNVSIFPLFEFGAKITHAHSYFSAPF